VNAETGSVEVVQQVLVGGALCREGEVTRGRAHIHPLKAGEMYIVEQLVVHASSQSAGIKV